MKIFLILLTYCILKVKIMRLVITVIFFCLCQNSFPQAKDSLPGDTDKKTEKVSFKTVVDIKNATKDGIYMNGYVVNISYEEANKLNGKKIKVTGEVTVIKGIKNLPNKDIQQGRETDTKYIASPKITIIKNSL